MTLSFSDLEHARAFSPRIIDVPSLNARVSDAIFECIQRVRKDGARAPSASLLLLGPAGAGKTHLFERLRRKAGPGATFVHVRPEIGIDASLRHVLLTVIDALKHPVADREYTQLDVVVGSALALVDGHNPKFPTAFLDQARTLAPEQREDLLERALERFEREDPGIDGAWLELFLGLPFLKSAERRAALAWLSGREPSELELRRLGRTEPMASSAVKPALRALAVVAAQAAPLVIVFDQLENLVEADGRADRIHAHARTFAELFDEVSRLVLVQMALDGEWTHRIGPELAASERSRLESRVLHVELPSAEQREELLHAWLELLPPEAHPGAFPAPFSRRDWAQLRSMPGATPRMLFVAARKALAGEDPLLSAEAEADTREEIDDLLARQWQEFSNQAHTELERAIAEKRGIHPTRLSAAIRLLLLAIPGTSVSMGGGAAGRETLRFSRDGEETLVFVIQATHARSVATALAHAAKSAEGKRTVVVREQALALPPTWKAANENLERVRRQPMATVLEPSRAELTRALALHDLYGAAQSQDLAGADGRPIPENVVRAWASRVLEPQGFTLALAKASLDELWETSTLPLLFDQRKRVEPGAEPAGEGVSLLVLRQLRLASVERIVAEAQRRDKTATRARVLAELRAHPGVRPIGRTLFHLPSEGG